MEYIRLAGNEIDIYLEEIAQLRIRIFREYPYLYEGSLKYEKKYLERYLKTPESLIILVKESDNYIAMTSCLPLSREEVNFQAPFKSAGLDLSKIFYFGESIVLPEFRGRGLGRKFFEEREHHAQKTLGKKLELTTFCSVDRSPNHPQRPRDYHGPESLWMRQGYQKDSSLKMELDWPEVGSEKEIGHTLTFWVKKYP